MTKQPPRKFGGFQFPPPLATYSLAVSIDLYGVDSDKE